MIPTRVSSKDPAEVIVLSFDFTAVLEAGETVASCAIAITDRATGADVTSSMATGPVDLAGAPIVKQRVHGGVAASTYLVRATATTSLTNVYVGGAILPVKAVA